jgi:hypothetical protein
MSANNSNESDMNNNEGQVVAVDQSSALQVETHGASLAIGILQEQIESGGQCEETADTQQVDSYEDMDEDEQEVECSSSDSVESFTIEVGVRAKFLHTPATRATELTDMVKVEATKATSHPGASKVGKRRLQVPSATMPSRSMTRQSDHVYVFKGSSRQQRHSTSSGNVLGQ